MRKMSRNLFRFTLLRYLIIFNTKYYFYRHPVNRVWLAETIPETHVRSKTFARSTYILHTCNNLQVVEILRNGTLLVLAHKRITRYEEIARICQIFPLIFRIARC